MPRPLRAALVVLFLVFLAACATTANPSPPRIGEGAGVPTRPATITPPATRTATPTPTPTPVAVWVQPGAPAPLAQAVAALSGFSTDYRQASTPTEAPLRVEILKPGVGARRAVPLLERVYVPVVPFPTLPDDIAWADIRAFWVGDGDALKGLSDNTTSPTLFISAETRDALTTVLGQPADSARIVIAPADELITRTWAARPAAWAIVPFEALQPRWKVLRLDGLDIFDRELDLSRYPLALRWGVSGPASEVAAFVARLPRDWVATNRNPQALTIVAMTGVTAIARHSSTAIKRSGDPLYPARAVADILRQADITHVSNEIPFYEDCPPGETQGLSFCSPLSYFNILTTIGTDVVELTGNHLLDKGVAPFLRTLEMYDQAKLLTFGGGRDRETAFQPARFEDHGNKIAFLGCNAFGPASDWATETTPGSAPCDYERLWPQVAALRQQGYVVIFTFQWEEAYQYEPLPHQVSGFRRAVEAGAHIVSGSQAHQPQGMEFYQDGLILYGLGNFFFDQMWSLGTRQGLIARHVIYQGRHIATDLITTLLYDSAQPRPTSGADRQALLRAVFAASGW
ncbi:MAG: hypothetical protein C4311_05115 [Chloroflexota bacterium]